VPCSTIAQRAQHRLVLRMTGLRRIRRRHQASSQRFEIQPLGVLETGASPEAGTEPGAHPCVIGVALGHAGVVGAELL
jgi:hypothetical protein